jgi:hypothetical protein
VGRRSRSCWNIDGKQISATTWKRHKIVVGSAIAGFTNWTHPVILMLPTRCRVIIPHTVSQLPRHFSATRFAMATGDFVASVPVVEPWVPTIHLPPKGNGGASGVAGADKGGDIQSWNRCSMSWNNRQSRSSGRDRGGPNPLNLPARGHQILTQAARDIFSNVLPLLIQDSLVFESLSANMLMHHVQNLWILWKSNCGCRSTG